MSLLSPQSIAVIGASATPGKVGHDILKNLLTQGFAGPVYPVNPKGGKILGAKTYASIDQIPTVPDLAIIVIPAAAVPASLEECGVKGIRNVVVISAGFGEVHTEEGKSLEQKLGHIARKHQLHLIGPNCLGILNTHISMNASFAKELPPKGSVGLISQSGATAVALMDAAAHHGIGFSSVISIGNKSVLDECDFLDMLSADEQTTVIGLYLENFKRGKIFFDLAMKIARRKSIVLLKAGVSQQGAKAAASHTGALAGADAAIRALCAQTGIIRAQTSEDFFDLLSILSLQPPLLSDRVAIITNAGGPGILATDAAAMGTSPLTLAPLAPQIAEELQQKLPTAASIDNPIDLLGDAPAERYGAALLACKHDPSIDGVILLLTPQIMTPCDDIARVILETMKSAPLMPIATCFMGGDSVHDARLMLLRGSIPCYETPERAVRALQALRQRTPEASVLPVDSQPEERCAAMGASFERKEFGLLSEGDTSTLFAAYSLPLPKQAIAKSGPEAANLAAAIGFPVVLKISSPQILHKTDVGGIRANITTRADAQRAYDDIIRDVSRAASHATVNGILIQQYLPVGDEFIVGLIRDPSFGPLVMVGLGGIYTELFADTAFRIAPVTTSDAYAMLQELTAWKLLLGMRGKGQADIDALAGLIVTVSQMALALPTIRELDLNPVLVGPQGIVIADAKVLMG